MTASPAATETSDCLLILDPAWTPDPADLAAGLLGIRSFAARVLAREDYLAVTTRLLDDWVEASGIVEAMTVDGTSFWYHWRLWTWHWLHERLIWIDILDEIIRERGLAAVALPEANETALSDAVSLVAQRDGLEVAGAAESGPGRTSVPAGENDASTDASSVADPTPTPAADIAARSAIDLASVIRSRLRAIVYRARLLPSDRRRQRLLARRMAMDRRLDGLVAEGGGRILAVIDPKTYQEIVTPTGARLMDPFVGPVLEQLAGGPLDPVVVELRSRADDDRTWARVSPRTRRIVPGDVVDRRFSKPGDMDRARASAASVQAAIAGAAAPLRRADVDLGPVLQRLLETLARDALPARLRNVARIGRLLMVIRPSAILTINEYGRTEWLAAAASVGVPVVAVQHGVVHRWHPGYVHRDRPAARPIPDRTYVFGDFERRLLTEMGGYRPDEIVVAGSPRLDVRTDEPRSPDRDRLRAKLEIGPDDRLIVVSTTFGTTFRRFHTPVVLAELFPRPVPRHRIVIKLHPGEPDGDLYRRLLAGLEADGRDRSDLAIVKQIDLYQLLAAADAHLGMYSTVLTEAVAVGTPNLLAAPLATSDLIDYVEAGVAVPIRTAADLEAVMAAGPPPPDPERRAAFLADHFLEGSASRRIADDIAAWLARSADDRRAGDEQDVPVGAVRR